MPEFIKLIDGSLATKGRNLALNSSPNLYVYQLYSDQLTSNTKTSIEKVMTTFGHDEYAYSPAPEDVDNPTEAV